MALFHYILCRLHRTDTHTHSSASAWDWHSNSKVLFLASLTLPVPFQWHLVWVLSLKVKVERVITSAPNLWKYAVKNVFIFMVCDITEKQNCVYVDFYKILNSVKTAGWRRRKLTELFEPRKEKIKTTHNKLIWLYTCKLVKKEEEEEERYNRTAGSGFHQTGRASHAQRLSRGFFFVLPKRGLRLLIWFFFFFVCVVSQIRSLRLSHSHYLSSLALSVESGGAIDEASRELREETLVRAGAVCLFLFVRTDERWVRALSANIDARYPFAVYTGSNRHRSRKSKGT